MKKNYALSQFLKYLVTNKFLYITFFTFLSYLGFSQTVTLDVTDNGTSPWVVPAGVSSVTIECWGAGGAGGGSSINGNSGAGGGGGAYTIQTYTVTVGQNINYVVGAGGAGVRGTGGNGGNTTIAAPFNLVANGGGGGGNNGGVIGAGGTATGGASNVFGQDGGTGGTATGGDGGDGANGGVGGAGQADNDGLPGTAPGGGGGGAERRGGGSDGGDGGDGQIRITYTINTAPSNDECTNAIALTVNADQNCGAVTAGTIDGATDSGINSGCRDADDDDVWFTFQATSTSHTIDLLNITGSTSDLYHAIYAADPCSGPDTEITCSDPNSSITSGLTIGATYYVQVFSWSTATSHDSTFDICVGTPPPPPGNDECSNAIALTVNPDYACGNTTPGTIENATDSGMTGTTCRDGDDDDVWFSFTATANQHRIELLNMVGSTTDLYFALYDASVGCGSLGAAGLCSDAESADVTGFIPGNTYYMQVFSWSSTTSHDTSFDVCVGTPPPCTAPNTPAAPITFGTITDGLIDGTFPASVPVADNYLVLMNTTGIAPTAPADGVEYTIGDTSLGATVIDNDTNTNFTATGLNQLTTYYFYIFAFNNTDCNGGPLYSSGSITNNATTPETTYCIPSSTDPTYFIDDFITTGGSTNINHTGTGFSGGGYGDFTGRSVTQLPGSAINFTIVHSGGTFQANIWVDWNNDLDFDDVNEQVFNAPGYVATQNGSFIVLNTAPAGSYRMRVRSDFISSNVSSCGFDDESETHDYTLIVSPLNCTADPITVVASSTSPTTGTITWTAPSPAPGNGYEYVVSLDNTPNTPGGDITGTTTNTTVNLTGLTAGTTYYVFVRGDCNGTDQGLWLSSTFSTGCTTTVNTPTICGIIIDEDTNNPFIADPFIANPTGFIDCNNNSLTLEAHANLRETTSYIVEQTNFPTTPPDFEFNDGLGTGTNQGLNTSDDLWAGSATSIGFDFNFYGNCYDEILVGANGMITFDLINNLPSTSHGFTIPNNLPSTVPLSLSEYTIFGVMHDLDPRQAPSSAIKSRTIGTAPCRQFQVSWHDIPMYDDNSILYTGMIVIHETSNIIEVFIEEKRIDDDGFGPWNSGNALVGIQGNNVDTNPGNAANEYTVAPCRNSLDPNWETFNEAWRFSPNGAVIAPNSVDWFSMTGGATSIGSGTTFNVTSPDTYTAISEYTVCGNTVTFQDDIVVTSSTLKTWNGTVSQAWTDPDNWTPNTEPDLSDCVLIPRGLTRYPIIDGIYDDAEAGTLTIEGPTVVNGTDEGNLLILAGGTLTVNDEVIIEPQAILELEGIAGATGNTSGNITTFDSSLTANLIQNDDSAVNSGELTMERYVYVRNRDYVYWSSPIENHNTSSIFGTSLIYEWIPTIYIDANTQFGNWSAAGGSIMSPGKGYIVRGPNGNGSTNDIGAWNSALFTGVPHNGVYQPTIERGTDTSGGNGNNDGDPGDEVSDGDDDNWNLIGNPYPSGLSADAFLLENAAVNPRIDGVVYLWQHGINIRRGNSPFFGDFVFSYDEADYLAYNYLGASNGFNGVIGSSQGFFVFMDDGYGTANGNSFEGSVTFNNNMRVGSDEMFFRNSNPESSRTSANIERHRIWLSLVQPSNNVSTTLVGYADGATIDKDRMFDAGLISGSSRKLYSIIENDTDKYVIQGRPLPFDESDIIPLGVIIEQEGEYAINIEDVDGIFDMDNQQNIFIEDSQLGIIHNLKDSPYFFTPTEMGEFTERFRIRFTTNSLGIDEFTNNSVISIIAPNSDYIKINSTRDLISSVIVYDILGRNLMSFNNVDEQELIIENGTLSDGILIVKVTLANGNEKVQKVVLRQ